MFSGFDIITTVAYILTAVTGIVVVKTGLSAVIKVLKESGDVIQAIIQAQADGAITKEEILEIKKQATEAATAAKEAVGTLKNLFKKD